MLLSLNMGRLCHFFKTGATLFSGPVVSKIGISGKQKQPDLCYLTCVTSFCQLLVSSKLKNCQTLFIYVKFFLEFIFNKGFSSAYKPKR